MKKAAAVENSEEVSCGVPLRFRRVKRVGISVQERLAREEGEDSVPIPPWNGDGCYGDDAGGRSLGEDDGRVSHWVWEEASVLLYHLEEGGARGCEGRIKLSGLCLGVCIKAFWNR